MALSTLDQRIFAIDRTIELTVMINGVVIPAGLDTEGNIKGVDITYDIEQMPPTLAMAFSKEQLSDAKSGLPSWVERGMDVAVDGGYDGELVRIFTGRVKRRRHGVGADVIDCVGRTGKLSRPYRVAPPKSFQAFEARAAIIDILDDYGVDFTPAGGEQYNIDPILMDDGNPWIMGTAVDAVMDMATPSDMIRKIADVYGHRMYELTSGVLEIRDLLEVPAPHGFRTYTTDAAGADQTAESTLSYASANIDNAFGQVWQVDISTGPTFVDETDDANNSAGPDWTIFPAVEAIGDYVTIGGVTTFDQVVFDNAGGTAGVGGVVVWEYWNGALWFALAGVTDGTTGFTAAAADGQSLTFTIPGDWAAQVLNGSASLFYIRARITTVYGTNPIYDQGWLGGAPAMLGNVSANTQRSQGFLTTAGGGVTSVTMFVRKVGTPNDGLYITILRDDGSGLPSVAADRVLAYSNKFPGSTLDRVTYNTVLVTIPTAVQLEMGTAYHLAIARTGALDAVNYYEIGIAQVTPSFPDGVAGVFDGTVWTAEDAGGNGADHPFAIDTITFAALRVLDIADEEDEDQVKKQFTVLGAVIPSTDAEGNEINTQITQTVEVGSDDLVAGLPELFAMTYQNDLIDTDQVAADVAARLVDKYHRVLQTIEIEVPFDPRMQLGTTITIDDPAVTGVSGNWWVHGYSHSLSPEGAVTQLSLFGGDQSGTTGLVLPRPDFTWIIERELIGNALMAIVTFTDNSTDLDGWIVDYHWVDNYAGGVNDVQGGDLNVVTFAYDPGVDGAIDMTLTVTDNDGNTNSITLSIDVSTDNEEVFAPAVACAGGNTCMVTFDGGLSWDDLATPGGEDARVCDITQTYDPDDNLIAFFGTTVGNIYRSDDNMATLTQVYNDAHNSPVTSIVADNLVLFRLWATISDGKVLRSNDYGVTWFVYKDFELARAGGGARSHRHDAIRPSAGDSAQHVIPMPLNGILLSEPSVGRIWVFGGVGTDPETWLHTKYLGDGPTDWYSVIANTAHGDAEASSVATSTGVAGDTVVDAVRSHRTSNDMGLVFTGRNPPYMYSTPQFVPAETAAWRDPTGMPAVDGVSVRGNHGRLALFGGLLDNANFYRANDALTFEELVGVLPGTGANRPNDLLNIGAWSDIYLAATDEGIGKSIDYGETWDFFRPVAAPISTTWPGGAIGWDVAIVYRRPRQFNLASIILSNAGDAIQENALAIRTTAGGWEDHGPVPTARIDRPHRLWHFPQISDQVLFHVRYVSATLTHSEDLYRTPDQGATWTLVLAKAYALATAPDGTLWATHEPHAGGHAGSFYAHVISRSTDDGLTWQEVFDDTAVDGGTLTHYKDIAVDPNNSNRIMAIGNYPATNIATLLSTDATLGASSNWTRVLSGLTFDGIAPRYPTPWIMAGDSERWIIGLQPAGANRIRILTNDQNGVPAAWTLRYDVVTAAPTLGFGDRVRAGNILFAIGTQLNDAEGILRSVDNGTTWQIVNAATDTGSGVWDAQVDMLVTGRRSFTDTFIHYQPPEEGAAARLGLDTGLEAAMGYTLQAQASTQGLAILRRAGATGSPTELWAIGQAAVGGGDTHIWLREAISDSWRDYLDIPDTAAAENRFPIWHFSGMGDTMFRLKIGDLGDAALGYGGPLERSTDRGQTWATVLTNAGSLARGRDGNLWATRDDRAAPAHFQPRSIYRSVDNGITWVLRGTDTTAGVGGSMTKYTQIRVDPNNADRIMAVGGLEADTMRSAYSPDNGATWTFRSGGMSFRSGTAAVGNSINLEAGGAGRWIIGLSQADGLAKFIFVSDDFGANWTQKYTVVTTAVTYGWVDSVRTAGGDLYAAGNGGGAANAVDGRVVVSTDNGDTWAPFTADDRTDIMAVTYDNSQATLYIGRGAAANNVLYMKNPTVLGIWSDDSIPSSPRIILQESLEVVT